MHVVKGSKIWEDFFFALKPDFDIIKVLIGNARTWATLWLMRKKALVKWMEIQSQLYFWSRLRAEKIAEQPVASMKKGRVDLECQAGFF